MLPPRYKHLIGAHFTSVEPFLGWRHFHVGTLQREGRGYRAEVISSVDPTSRAWVDARTLFDPTQWRFGWSSIDELKTITR